jgi:tetratricopeptide (TPR) repeat protein
MMNATTLGNGWRGRGTVLAMLAIGAVLATVTVTYWRAVADRAAADRAEHRAALQASEAASKADLTTAERELKELQESFLERRREDLDRLVQWGYRLVDRHPQYAEARVLLAQMLLDALEVQSAYEQMETALELDPQQPEVRRLAGDLALILGRNVDAARHYSTAVSLAPRDATYRLHLSQAYMNMNEMDRARDTLLEALRIDSSLHKGYAAMSDIYAKQNKTTLALTQIGKAIEHTPISERDVQVIYIRRQGHLLRRDNRPREALMSLQALTLKEQRDAEVLQEMAVCWAMLGQPLKGAELFEAELAMSPRDWQLLAGAAEWRLKAGDAEAAQRHVQRLEMLDQDARVGAALVDLRERLAAAGQ